MRAATTTDTTYRSHRGQELVEQQYRRMLGQWPVAADHHTVTTRAGDTFVVSSGPADAPPVVALQGAGANTAMWLPAIGGLASDLRVHAIDVPGEPGFSAPTRWRLDASEHVEWLDDVLDGLGLDRAAVVGVSLGGWLAADYAARRPERITRLALINPSGIGRRRLGVLLCAVLFRLFGAWGRRRVLAAAVGRGAAASGEVAADLATFTLLVLAHFRHRTEPIPTFDDAALAGWAMPVLAVLGERDTLIDAPGTARRLRTAAPHVRVHLLPGAGHVLDDGGRVAAFLRDGAP